MLRVRIETRRLVLWTLEDSDVESVFAHRSDPEVCRYIGPTMSREEVVRHVSERQQSWKGNEGDVLSLACELKEPGRVVGEGVVKYISAAARQAELGLALQPQAQARELGTEVMAALLRYAFEQLGMHRVFALCDVDNEPSRRLMTRLGMRHEGVLRENLFRAGQWRDDHLFTLLEWEWESARPSLERFF